MSPPSTTTIYLVTDGISSPQTRKKYEYHFKHFLKHFDIPDKESLIDIGKDPRLTEGYIIRYIKYLAEEKHLVYSSIYNQVAAILHFFEMNDVSLNKRKIHKFIPPNESNHEDRPYTKVEIQRILDHCDERSRVIFLLMASTGMRIGAIDGIRFGDLIDVPEYNLYKILIYATSKKDRYYTFCTPECAKAIDEYRKHRERFGEVINKNSPLIRDNFDNTHHYRCEHPLKMTSKGISSIVNRTLLRAGVASDEVMMSHGLRKNVITLMKKAMVDYSDREYLVGHKRSRGLDVNYDRTTAEDRLQEYLKAASLLTINEEYRLRCQVTEQEHTIKVELTEKAKRIEELEQYVKEIHDIMSEPKKLKALMER